LKEQKEIFQEWVEKDIGEKARIVKGQGVIHQGADEADHLWERTQQGHSGSSCQNHLRQWVTKEVRQICVFISSGMKGTKI
jgi:electron transfer flavoprotein alpha/beta subunit